jgi:hypothetical protein
VNLRDGARGESRRRRVVWIVVAAVLVLGPLAFNLAREPAFEASVELFPRGVRPYPAVYDLRYYEALLEDPELREQMRINVGQGVASYDDVTFRRTSATTIAMSVEAETPRAAQAFVNGLAPQIAGATSRLLGLRAARDLERARERLADAEQPSPERRFLRGRIRRLATFGEFPPARALPGAPAPTPAFERWADRVVDDLPGDFRVRPSPLWAALAGLLVAATLWAICLALFPPRRR